MFPLLVSCSRYRAFCSIECLRLIFCLLDSERGESADREGWEIIEMQGQRVEIRTASLEEKCTAFDVLLVLCTIMGAAFRPYLSQSLSLALPALKFFFHDGVRETSAL